MTPSPGIEPGPHWWEASAQPLRHPCSPGIGGSFYKSERPGCYTFFTQTLNGTRIFSCWHGSNSLAPQEASLVGY